MCVCVCVCVCVCTGDSVVGIRTRIYAGRSVVRIPAGATHLSLLQNILMGSGALFSEYRFYCPGVKRLGRDVDPSAVSSAKVRNECSYGSAALICPHGVDWDNFIFLPYYKDTEFCMFVLKE